MSRTSRRFGILLKRYYRSSELRFPTLHSTFPGRILRQACVVVAPLLHGGGTRLKILDAAACGKPIVSTRVGAEGLNFVEGRDLLLADSAQRFAKTVVALLTNPERQAELSQWARRAAEAYDWSGIASEFCSVMTGAAQRHRGVRYGLQPLETDAAAHRENSYG